MFILHAFFYETTCFYIADILADDGALRSRHLSPYPDGRDAA